MTKESGSTDVKRLEFKPKTKVSKFSIDIDEIQKARYAKVDEGIRFAARENNALRAEVETLKLKLKK